MQEALSSARQCLERARQRVAVNADKHRRDEQYQPGDLVLLSTRNIKFRGKKINKLMPKYIGPFKIRGKVGSVAYKLQLPDKYQLHPTFHVVLLRRYQTDPRRVLVNQPDDEIEGEKNLRSRGFLTIKTVRNLVDHELSDGTFSLDGKGTLPVKTPGNQKITLGNVRMPCKNIILAGD
jgi:hypothetical protein